MKESWSGRELLASSQYLFEPFFHAAVDAMPASMRRIVGHHIGWSDEHGRPVAAGGGKAIRPTLALLAAEAVGGTPVAAIPAAVAVELVHNFSLLHDDIMDGDDTRRHRPTSWKVFGVGAAILAGDALLALAFDVLAGSGQPVAQDGSRLLSHAVVDMIDGQAADLSFEKRAEVGLAEYFDMAEGKTGALFGCACALGASFAGGRAAQAERLCAFGIRLGVAFQIVDDLLGIWGDPVMTGKPMYSDLRNRKKSLPVVAALTSGTAAGRELSALYACERTLSGPQLVRVAELVEHSGARTWSVTRVSELLTEALEHLDAAAPAEPARTKVLALARLLVNRDTDMSFLGEP